MALSQADIGKQLAALYGLTITDEVLHAFSNGNSGLLLLLSFWGLLEAYRATENTSSRNPTYRLNEIAAAIATAREAAAEQYEEFGGLMDEATISDIDRRFDTLYATALGFEDDYREFLFNYKQSIFHVAGRIGGSGVWHDFYTQRLDQFINNSRYQERRSDLRSALHDKRRADQ